MLQYLTTAKINSANAVGPGIHFTKNLYEFWHIEKPSCAKLIQNIVRVFLSPLFARSLILNIHLFPLKLFTSKTFVAIPYKFTNKTNDIMNNDFTKNYIVIILSDNHMKNSTSLILLGCYYGFQVTVMI